MTTPAALIRKSFDATTKVVDEAQGLVEAIVNTTGIVDLQNEILEVGSWDGLCKSMAAGEVDYPTILSNHNWDVPVGRVVHAEELMPGDTRLAKSAMGNPAVGGLRIIGQYNLDTQRGREAYSDVSKGIVRQWSVGFFPDESSVSYDKEGVRHTAKIGLWHEVSNVLVGASPGTRTTATKSAEAILSNPEVSLSDKAAAVEQACLQAVEDGDSAEAIAIAIEALHALSAEHATYKDRLIKEVVERLTPPPQHSDPEPSGEDELIPSWAMWNVSLARIAPKT